jgi:isoleucyl-tRNA synthetase
MPYAQWHYPFENNDAFDRSFPADFICEAVDQTRGWFYTLHAEAALLNYAAPEMIHEPMSYRNVICLGLVLDGKGEAMRTSRGNVTNPWEVINATGVDALRWYLFTATAAGEPRRFSLELVQEALRKFLLTLWNTYSFFVTYARIDDWRPDSASGSVAAGPTPADQPENELDRWLLSELNLLVKEVTAELEAYNPTDAGRAIAHFVDDMSNWYVRRSRRRFWKSENDLDKQAAYQTLYTALTTVARLLAPFTPYVADEIYRNLVTTVAPDAPESVHLDDWPKAAESLIDAGLAADTRLIMRLSSLGRAARARAQIKVRQPLATAIVKARNGEEAAVVRRLSGQLVEEINVKSVELTESEARYVNYAVKPNLPLLGPRYGEAVGRIQEALQAADPAAIARMVDGGGPVKVDGFQLAADDVLVERSETPGYAVATEAGYLVAITTNVTAELAEEGFARELVHRLQTMRRSAGLDIADRIVTYIEVPESLQETIKRHEQYLKQETLSDVVTYGPPAADVFSEKHRVDGHELELGVSKLGG